MPDEVHHLQWPCQRLLRGWCSQWWADSGCQLPLCVSQGWPLCQIEPWLVKGASRHRRRHLTGCGDKQANRPAGRLRGRSTAGPTNAAMREAVVQQEQRSWPADKDAATGPGNPQSGGNCSESVLSCWCLPDQRQTQQCTCRQRQSSILAEGTRQICQQPAKCPVQQQSCTKCSTSPGGLPVGLSRTRGMLQRPSRQVMLRLRLGLRLGLRLRQRTPGMRRLRSRQSRWVLPAKRVRLSAANRTVFLGQASWRHQQKFSYVGRACKPTGYSVETCTALRMISYLAAAVH